MKDCPKNCFSLSSTNVTYFLQLLSNLNRICGSKNKNYPKNCSPGHSCKSDNNQKRCDELA